MIPDLARRQESLFACPECGADLKFSSKKIVCRNRTHSFNYQEGIPLLFAPTRQNSKTDVTEKVRRFYDDNPFPNYDGIDSRETLEARAKQGLFALALRSELPKSARVLEVGCGTGQFSNFLAAGENLDVFAADASFQALKLGNEFKNKHRLSGVSFLQMNLFKPAFKPKTFDLVICNGVLHHTSDPFLGFQALVNLVKDNGLILVGLYNKYGCLYPAARRLAVNKLGKFGKRLIASDPYFKKHSELSEAKKRAWFMDQYQHPHESVHTIGEVLDWFDQSSVEFIGSMPAITARSEDFSQTRLFLKQPGGTRFSHFISQIRMALRGKENGGLFIMIGLRNTINYVRSEARIADLGYSRLRTLKQFWFFAKEHKQWWLMPLFLLLLLVGLFFIVVQS